jgi:hypothetical protein
MADSKELFELISAVCPITALDSNGKIEYDPKATEDQKAAALSILNQHLSDPIKDPLAFTDVVKLARATETTISFAEFLEAYLDDRFGGDSSKLDSLKIVWAELKAKYNSK